MTLKLVKQLTADERDYNVSVFYNGQLLDMFKLSQMISAMFEKGHSIYPERIHEILTAYGINDLTVEQIDEQLSKGN